MRLFESFEHQMTTQAEKETIEAFCRELALALRRITGRVVEIKPDDLPVPLKEVEPDIPEEGLEANAPDKKEESQEP